MEVVRKFGTYEQWSTGPDFTGKLPSGVTLESGSATVTDLSDGADVTNTLLTSGTCTISGNQALVTIRAGSLNRDYLVDVRVVADNGDQYRELFRLEIRDE